MPHPSDCQTPLAATSDCLTTRAALSDDAASQRWSSTLSKFATQNRLAVVGAPGCDPFASHQPPFGSCRDHPASRRNQPTVLDTGYFGCDPLVWLAPFTRPPGLSATG
jgi:hypothetical protein